MEGLKVESDGGAENPKPLKARAGSRWEKPQPYCKLQRPLLYFLQHYFLYKICPPDCPPSLSIIPLPACVLLSLSSWHGTFHFIIFISHVSPQSLVSSSCTSSPVSSLPLMDTNLYPNIHSTAAAAIAGGTPSLQNSAAPQLKCPRCDSTNTKFCYYNNYSLAQPRHFCRTCKRYWTRGGTLRDVPIGGGCRKNKRHKKPQSAIVATLPNSPPLRLRAKPLPPPAADLSSLIVGMPPTNLSNRFFPMLEETIQSGIGSHHIYNLQQSLEAVKTNQPPLLCYDDLPTICERFSLIEENPNEEICYFNGSSSAAAQSAYLYTWPESCSPVVRLL